MPSIEGFTPENVRANVLPRVFLLRSLATRMEIRLRRAEYLVSRAYDTLGEQRIFAWITALSIVWTLVENTLKLYETIAEQVDTRFEGKRRSLDSRFQRERSGDERIDFQGRVWMFAMIDQIPDAAWADLGIEPLAARTLIQAMVDRSRTYLASCEERMRVFYREYKVVMNAQKHGRALFAFVPAVERHEGGQPKRVSLRASIDAVTALVSNQAARSIPTRLLTITADDELISDIANVFAVLKEQLPKLRGFFEAMADASLQLLALLEHAPEAHRPTLPLSFFAEPYSPDETALLQKMRARPLRF